MSCFLFAVAWSEGEFSRDAASLTRLSVSEALKTGFPRSKSQ